MTAYADPPALDCLDQVAAACARSPSYARRLVALAKVANLTPTPVTTLSLELPAGWYTLSWQGAPTMTVALAHGQSYSAPGVIYLEAEADGEDPDTLTITVTSSAHALTLTAASAVAAHLALMEGEHVDAAAPRIILAPPRLASSLAAVAEWEHQVSLPLYLLGDGDPAGSSAVAHRRYEIQALGLLALDLVAQSSLGLMRWQIVGADQAETVGLDPTGALRGHYLGQLTLTAEGQT